MSFMKEKILKLKKEKNALILAHNYQDKSIYEIADFIGDSLELAQKAKETKADIIVFCGVYFMAETAKILNPAKIVLLPEIYAGCPMADMANEEIILKLKKENPKAITICYINTTAKIKSLCDICVTSANALKIISSLKEEEIIFLPDRNLANYIAKNVNKKIIPYDGYCFVHEMFSKEDVKNAKEKYPEALFLAHPESPLTILNLADYVCSTSQMLSIVKNSEKQDFIIGTELGMIDMLKRKFPKKKFYPLSCKAICQDMKKTSLTSVLKALEKIQYKVEVDEKTAFLQKNV